MADSGFGKEVAEIWQIWRNVIGKMFFRLRGEFHCATKARSHRLVMAWRMAGTARMIAKGPPYRWPGWADK